MTSKDHILELLNNELMGFRFILDKNPDAAQFIAKYESMIAAVNDAIFDTDDLIAKICEKTDVSIIRKLMSETDKDKARLLAEKIKSAVHGMSNVSVTDRNIVYVRSKYTKTLIIIKNGWKTIASYDSVITLHRGDVFAMPDGMEYDVECSVFDSSDNTVKILVK